MRIVTFESGVRVVRNMTAAELAELPTADDAAISMRSAMTCTPAQIRLALLDMDLLTTVQSMADGDPSASIVWEYATTISRLSPFIEALKQDTFTDTQIDDIFNYAKGLLA